MVIGLNHNTIICPCDNLISITSLREKIDSDKTDTEFSKEFNEQNSMAIEYILGKKDEGVTSLSQDLMYNDQRVNLKMYRDVYSGEYKFKLTKRFKRNNIELSNTLLHISCNK